MSTRTALTAVLLALSGFGMHAQTSSAEESLRREIQALREENEALRRQLRPQKRGISTLSREAVRDGEFSVLSRWDTFTTVPVSHPADGAAAFSLEDADALAAAVDRADTVFHIGCTDLVRKYVRIYTVEKKDNMTAILARYHACAPMFREVFSSFGIPEEVTVLSIVESAVNPGAVSSAGAVGIWQLMDGTARELGLSVNYALDERTVPRRSTEAAARMLSDAYRTFGRWDLAVLSYNCGTGRLKTALKSSNGGSYEDIRGYLPRETEEYLPALVAAVFVVRNADRVF